MIEMHKAFEKLTLDDIKRFETENNVKLTELYTKFLLENNGGYPKKSDFLIPDGQDEDVVISETNWAKIAFLRKKWCEKYGGTFGLAV